MEKIKGRFNWRSSGIVPAFVEGEDARAIYDACDGIRTGTMGYDEKSKLFYGSTPFVAARIDSLVQPLGLRAANLGDLSRPEVMALVKDRFYTDAPILVLRSMNDSYSKNLPIIKRIAKEAEKANGKVQLPLMITGFDVKNCKEDGEGYGINLFPRADFKAIHDDRLSGEYGGKRFSEVDEFGLPKFDESGNRTWYTRNEGLSSVCLSWNLDLYSDWPRSVDLASSLDNGRVVLITGGVTQKNLDAEEENKMMADELRRAGGQYQGVEQDNFYSEHIKYVKYHKRRNIVSDVLGTLGLAALGFVNYSLIKNHTLDEAFVGGAFTCLWAGIWLKMRHDNKRKISELEKLADELKGKK